MAEAPESVAGFRRFAGACALALQVVAFWPVWEWVAGRMIQFPENRVGLVALAAAVVFVILRAREGRLMRPRLEIAALLTVVYAFTYPWVHPLVHSGLAFTAMGVVATSCMGARGRTGFVALLLLALPVIPSMQTHIGFPLRTLTASVTAPWLRLIGYGVVPEGTCLRWGEEIVMIDEPCSGIRMLWAGLFLAATIACFAEMRLWRAACTFALAVLALVAGNVVRSGVLFFVEAKIVKGAAWWHEGAGIAAFVCVAACIVSAGFWLGERRPAPCFAR